MDPEDIWSALPNQSKVSLALLEWVHDPILIYMMIIDYLCKAKRLRSRQEDELKTAFRTHYRQYKYVVMLFGLCNAPSYISTFNNVFHNLSDHIVIVYLDYILIVLR